MWIAQTRIIDGRWDWDTLHFRKMGGGHTFIFKKRSKWKTLTGAVRSLQKHIDSNDCVRPDMRSSWQYRLLNEETGESVPWEIFG